jgi:hypothetical protein
MVVGEPGGNRFGRRPPGGVHRHRRSRGAREQKRSFDQTEDFHRDVAGPLCGHPGRCEALLENLQPRFKRVGGGGPHQLVGVGDLQRDRRDRAGVAVVGLLEQAGRLDEGIGRRLDDVGPRRVDGLEHLPVALATVGEGRGTQLLLTAGEKVVQRTVRRGGGREDGLDTRRPETLSAEQIGRGLHQADTRVRLLCSG